MKRLIFAMIFFIFYTASTNLLAEDTPETNTQAVPPGVDLKGCDPTQNVCNYTAKTQMELFNYFKSCNTLVNIKISLPIENNQIVSITADPNNFCMFTIDGIESPQMGKPPLSISCSLSEDEVKYMTAKGDSLLNDFYNTKSASKEQMSNNYKPLVDCIKSKVK